MSLSIIIRCDGCGVIGHAGNSYAGGKKGLARLCGAGWSVERRPKMWPRHYCPKCQERFRAEALSHAPVLTPPASAGE